MHMFENEDEFFDLPDLLHRYEEMVREGTEYFFDVEEYEMLSGFLFDTGQTQKALQLVRQGIRQHPVAPELMVKRVRFLTTINKLKEADKEVDKLESLIPGSYDLFVARGLLYSKRSQHQKAIRFFKEALPQAEFPEDVWGLLAIEYQFTGNYRLAIRYLKRILEVNPYDEMSLYNLALCYDLMGSTEAGIEFMKDFIDGNPYNEIAWYQLGMLQSKNQQFAEAAQSFDYAIVIDEFFSAAYLEKADMQQQNFEFAEAIKTYQQSIEIDGATGYVYYLIALNYLKLHRPVKAESYLRQAINEEPDLDEAYYELALLHDENKSWDEAVYHIGKAVEMDAENWDYLYASAEIYKRAGRLNEAEVVFNDLIQLGYIDPQIFIDYAELLFDLCEFKMGMDLLYQGVQLNPEASEIMYRLAGYLYTLQENDEADIYLKKALQLAPQRRVGFFVLFPKLKNNPHITKILAEA